MLIEELREPALDAREKESPAGPEAWPSRATGTDVAVIGMAGRFPGASDLDRFWDNLTGGVEGLRRLTDEELRTWEPHFEDKARDPDFVPVVGTLDDVEMFDADFFGFQPGEARTLDPQLGPGSERRGQRSSTEATRPAKRTIASADSPAAT